MPSRRFFLSVLTAIVVSTISFASIRFLGQTSGQNAQCVSSTLPARVLKGQQINATITVKNTGTTAWTGSDTFLHIVQGGGPIWGLSNDGATWTGWPSTSIAPGQTVTIPVTGTAPTTAGSYPFKWQMVTQGDKYFGGICGQTYAIGACNDGQDNDGDGKIDLADPACLGNRPDLDDETDITYSCNAVFPTTVSTNQNLPVTLTLTNTGNAVWSSPQYYLLGARIGPQSLSGGPYSNGQSATFTFTDMLPSFSPGTYPVRWQLIRGPHNPDAACSGTITVVAQPDYEVLAVSGSSEFVRGTGTATVDVSIRNNGPGGLETVQDGLVFRLQDLPAGVTYVYPGVELPPDENEWHCTQSGSSVFCTAARGLPAPGNPNAPNERTFLLSLSAAASVPCDTTFSYTARADAPSPYVDASSANNTKTAGQTATVRCASVSSSSSLSSTVSSASSGVSSSSRPPSTSSFVPSSSSRVSSSSSSSSQPRYCCNTMTGVCTAGASCTQTFDQCFAACHVTSSSSSRPATSSRCPILMCDPAPGCYVQKPSSVNGCMTTCPPMVCSSSSSVSSAPPLLPSSRSSSAAGGLVCGNGIKEGSETCDDRNTAAGDGCSAVCQTESGWLCMGIQSYCIRLPVVTVVSSSASPVAPSSFKAFSSETIATSSFQPVPPPTPSSENEGPIVVVACPGNACGTAGNSICGGIAAQCVETSVLPCYACVRSSAPYVPASAVPAISLAPFLQLDADPRSSSARPRLEIIAPVCGNGTLEIPEECDDGNRTADDGCSPSCQHDVQPPTQALADTFHLAPLQAALPQVQYVQQYVYASPTHAPVGATGPGALAAMAAGAASGLAWIRKKRKP